MIDISIARGIDVSLVNKILTDNGFTLIHGAVGGALNVVAGIYQQHMVIAGL